MPLDAKVIAFTADATGEASAVQTLDVGFAWSFALFLSAGNVALDAFAGGYRAAIGFSDGANNRGLSGFAEDGVASSNNARRLAGAALTFVNNDGNGVLKEATAVADGTDCVLTWTTNDMSAFRCVALFLGGDDLAASRVGHATISATGNLAITAPAFTPSLVLFLTAGSLSYPSSGTGLGFMLGAMDADGNQWAWFVAANDNQTTMIESFGLATDGCILGGSAASENINTKASFVSMDEDGFTINVSVLASGRSMLYAALDLTDAWVGTVAKTAGAAPAAQSVTTPAFRPAAVFASLIASATAAGAGPHGRFGFGVTDFLSEVAFSAQATDNIADAAVDSRTASAKHVVKVNNATPAIDAEADASQTADGWDWMWTTNDAVATLIPTIAFGVAAAPPESPEGAGISRLALRVGL